MEQQNLQQPSVPLNNWPAPTLAGPGWYPTQHGLGYFDGREWTWVPEAPRNIWMGARESAAPEIPSFLGLAVGVILTLVGSFVFSSALTAAGIDDMLALFAVGILSVWLGLASGVVVAARANRTGVWESCGPPAGRKDWVRALALGVAFGVVARIGAGVLSVPFLPWLDTSANIGDALDIQSAFIVIFVLGPVAVLGAPLFEELFFRNVVQATLKRRAGIVAAVILQGAIFGLFHIDPTGTLGFNSYTVVAIGGVGILLGVLREKTGSLVPSIVAHATFNLFAVIGLLVVPYLEQFEQLQGIVALLF